MSQTTEIKIDIDVHRAIEARRATFTQSPNDILRVALGLPEAPRPQAPIHSSPKPRRTGTYAFELLGEKVDESSLKAAYKSILGRLAELDSRFLERFSERYTKSRRFVAQNPRELYLKKPELADDYAEQLTEEWWIDINLSREQVKQRLKAACEVAGLALGVDLVLTFPD